MMQFPEIRAGSQKERYVFRPMDARTVARIAGVKLGTLNAWVQRGLIPGMTIGTSGRRRSIEISTAVRIAILAELVRFGVAADDAATFVAVMSEAATQGGWLYIPGPEEQHSDPAVRFIVSHHPSHEGIVEHLQNLPDPPAVYAAVNVGKLAERVRQAEVEWQENRRGED